MKKVWNITIYSMKNGKTDVYETQEYTKKDVARVIMSFEPKRGYEIVKYRVEKDWWLV